MHLLILLLQSLVWPTSLNNAKSYLSRPLVIMALLIIGGTINFAWYQGVYQQRRVLGATTDLSASQVVALTNLQRTQAGVASVQPNEALSQAAQAKAEHMVSAGIFDHYYQDEQGQEITPWQFIDATGYSYMHAGENLGKDFYTAEKLVTAWMNSPAHRDNLLNQEYREIGIGIVEGPYLDSEHTTLVVQFFATPLSAAYGDQLAISDQTLQATPTLVYQESWMEQMLREYPTILLASSITVTFLIALAVIIDMTNSGKPGKDLEKEPISIQLWQH